MDLLCVKDLLKQFENIQLSPINNVVDILNKQVNTDIYYLNENNICLDYYVDSEAMEEQGFVCNTTLSYPAIDLFPMRVRGSYSGENDIVIVPNNIPIPKFTSIKLKKQFLINYFNHLKSIASSRIASLEYIENSTQEQLDEINNNIMQYILKNVESYSFVLKEELLNKGYDIIEFPIFPTNKMYSFIVKKDKINGLKYAHDVKKLHHSEYISHFVEKDGYYKLSKFEASNLNLTPLNTKQILDVFPHIYTCFFPEYKTAKLLEEKLISLKKEKAFFYDLKEEENFFQLINFIKDNVN